MTHGHSRVGHLPGFFMDAAVFWLVRHSGEQAAHQPYRDESGKHAEYW